jgi:hypothetical protein
MNKDGDLQDGIMIKMNWFYLVVVQKTAEEFTSGKAKSVLEEGKQHHDFIGVGNGNVFPFHWTPLEHGAIGRRWFSTRARSSLSSIEDGLNISRWEAAMARGTRAWATNEGRKRRKTVVVAEK